MNQVTLIGRLTADPEIRFTAGGTAVANFTLAVGRKFKNENGETESDFIRCIAWGKRAETIADYVKKGHLFGVNGSIQTGSYDDREGRKVYTTDVLVNEFDFLQPKERE